MQYEELNDREGFITHCKVVELIIHEMEINPHTKHHIRTAVREASNKITTQKGSNKDKAEYISKKAREQIQQGSLEGLIFEHGVPVSHLNSLILKRGKSITWEEIADIIYKGTVLSVVTKTENENLKKLKLSKKMPEEWDGKDKFARYTKSGIEIVKESYKKLKQDFVK